MKLSTLTLVAAVVAATTVGFVAAQERDKPRGGEGGRPREGGDRPRESDREGERRPRRPESDE